MQSKILLVIATFSAGEFHQKPALSDNTVPNNKPSSKYVQQKKDYFWNCYNRIDTFANAAAVICTRPSSDA